MFTTLTKNETEHTIQGPSGELELVKGEPTGTPRSAWGVICHPHSLYGGTMHNKVVTTLAKTFQDLGVSTVRFNFRGVGKSTGQFDKGQGEVDDLLAVIAWMQHEQLKNEIWLAGFSFGAYVATQVATQIPVNKLVTIAPPVTHFHMESLSPLPTNWVLVQGEKDEVVSAEAVLSWAETKTPSPTILRFPEADHFFHGQLVELRSKLEEVLR